MADFADLMDVVQPLNGLLEADGDEQADDDGGDVDEEIAPGGDGVVRWMDVHASSKAGWLEYRGKGEERVHRLRLREAI